jgi:hypothetical protein
VVLTLDCESFYILFCVVPSGLTKLYTVSPSPMTIPQGPSQLLSLLWRTPTRSGCTAAKRTIVNRAWFSQVSTLFGVSLSFSYAFHLVNPGSNFAAFQAAATGNSTTASATTAPAATGTGVVTVTATVTVAGGQAVTTTYGSYPGSAAPTAVSPQVHQVVVGGTGKLFYDPSNITAQVGDVIQFQFQQKNHTVTQVRTNFIHGRKLFLR